MRTFVVVIALCVIFSVPGWAEDEAPTCDKKLATSIAGNAKVSVTVKSTTSTTTPVNGVEPKPAWQPRGGTVVFTLRGNGASLDGVKVAVCYGWGDTDFIPSPNVWVTSTLGNEATYNSIVPEVLALSPPDARRNAFIVPIANMRLIIYGGIANPVIDVVRPVGITQPWLAAIFSVMGVVLGLGVFYTFARVRKVPGRGWLLWLISTRNGYASLSQLQIMLWTFVVVASAIYVMTLSGGLINITAGTLTLLGIAGIATLGSKLQSGQEDKQPQTPPTISITTPGPLPYLFVVGNPSDSDVRLAWAHPTTGGPATEYSVQYRIATPPGNWSAVNEIVRLPHHTVLGLAADTTYDFQVQPLNRGVPGPTSQLLGIKTANRPNDPPGAPGLVSKLRIQDPMQASSISIAWEAASNNPVNYDVQYRLHDSVEAWRSQTETMPRATIKKLRSGAQYDIRVAATNAAGQGSWTSILVCGTTRSPEWSDLVVSGNGPGEVDVTRVQMLLFTIVTALFVLLTVATDYQIPTIPDGFIILMGISNGLYVGSKFVPG